MPQLLVADIGNTKAHLGLFEGEVLLAQAGLASAEQTNDALTAAWDAFVDAVDGAAPASVVVASVNPKVKIPFTHWATKRFGGLPRVVGEDLPPPIELRVDHADEVGADRIVNAVWASRTHPGRPVVIVDLGTAVTFDVVSADGAYEGGLILPGLETAARALTDRTALLPSVRIQPTDRVIGKNTIDCINAGIFHGWVGLVDALIASIARELDVERGDDGLVVVATGGDAAAIAPRCASIDAIVPELTLHGLRLIAEGSPA